MKRQTHTAPAIAWQCIVVVSSPEQSFQDGSMMTYPTLALFDNQQGIVILKEPVELCSWQQAQWVFQTLMPLSQQDYLSRRNERCRQQCGQLLLEDWKKQPQMLHVLCGKARVVHEGQAHCTTTARILSLQQAEQGEMPPPWQKIQGLSFKMWWTVSSSMLAIAVVGDGKKKAGRMLSILCVQKCESPWRQAPTTITTTTARLSLQRPEQDKTPKLLVIPANVCPLKSS